MNKSESKYFNTAVRMDEALLDLLTRKDFDYITVKDICTQACVNRSTFYLHYNNTMDLLQECSERFIQKLTDCFETDCRDFVHAIPSLAPDQLILITPEYLLPYLRFLRKNQTVFLTMIQHQATFHLDDVFQHLSTNILRPIMERFAIPQKDQPYLLHFYLQGVIAMILEWIRCGCKETEEEFAKMMIRCILPWENRMMPWKGASMRQDNRGS